ncbi:MAG: YihY/virulence factor BrkB family protein [Nitrospirales bacterium]|nr:MAG: YihY/virulence factor BrkB family protein [Nitrospirales bacterium]
MNGLMLCLLIWAKIPQKTMKKEFENLTPISKEPKSPIPDQAWLPTLFTWWELGKRVVRLSRQHDILGRAAQLGYFFLLALFPALLSLTALVGMLPIQPILPRLMEFLHKVLPQESLFLVEDYLQHITQEAGSGIFSLSLLGSLVAASWGMMAVIETLNTVYNVQESRVLGKAAVTAVLLTTGAAAFVIVSITMILLGESLSQWIADAVGLSWLFTFWWTILQWPITFLFMLLATSLIYYWAPNIHHKWQWITPGSVVAVLLWILVSLAFKFYVEKLMNYDVVYGSITGVIVLMIWLYLSGLALLIGGELNAVLESKKLSRQETGRD